MFEGIPEIRKPEKITKSGKIVRGRVDTKAMAEQSFRKWFPLLDFNMTENGNKSKNVHDGLVDAILIAEYCRRKLVKN